MLCLICGGHSFRNYYYPEVHFNNKVFRYYECNSCYSAQIDPMPGADDYLKMYGENDHAYLSKMSAKETFDFEKAYPPFNHRLYQLNFFAKYQYGSKGQTLLDYGCGNGYYMYHAQKKGIQCLGIEFNKDFAAIMSEKTGLNITTLDTIKGKTFDIIHLGHVLEHMEDPRETLSLLSQHAHLTTIFVIDGPLEKNKCLSRFIIKTGSLIRGKKYNTYAPQHLTFTNYDSQLVLFKRCGLKKINYEVAEQLFPLPENFEIKNPGNAVKYFCGRVSIFISSLFPRMGNIFHYAGRLTDQA
jgi:SAM-dependent methyltransferase